MLLEGDDKLFFAELDIKTIVYAVVEGNKGNEGSYSDKLRHVGAEPMIKFAEMEPTLVSFWDEMVLRDGGGISIYSDIKVAIENTVLGMSENKLGFLIM